MRFNFLGLRAAFVLAAIAGGAIASPQANAGWFKDLTGVETPKPIRQIAPNGLSARGKPAPTSSFPAMSDPYIDSRGNVYGRSTNTNQTVVGKAKLIRNGRGEAIWISGSLPPAPATQFNPRPTPSKQSAWLQQFQQQARQQQLRSNAQQRQFQQQLNSQMQQFRRNQFQSQQQWQRMFGAP